MLISFLKHVRLRLLPYSPLFTPLSLESLVLLSLPAVRFLRVTERPFGLLLDLALLSLIILHVPFVFASLLLLELLLLCLLKSLLEGVIFFGGFLPVLRVRI